MYINTNKARQALYNLVGNRQTLSAEYSSLPSELTDSLSGRYFEELEPVAPDLISEMYTVSNTTAPLWDELLSYSPDQRVAYEGVEYKALSTTTPGEIPGTDPLQWEVVPLLQLSYEQQRVESLNAFINDVRNVRMLPDNTKQILTRGSILTAQPDRNRLQPNKPGTAVGLEFIVKPNDGQSVRLMQFTITLSGPATFNVYLYTYGQSGPISTQEIVYTRSRSEQTFVLTDFEIPMYSDIGSGERFQLVYYQDDILPQQALPIYRNQLYSGDCSSCSGFTSNRRFAMELSKYLTVKGIEAPEQAGREVWSQGDTRFTDSTNYGIKLNLSVECDITDVFIEQYDKLIEAYMLRYAYDVARKQGNTRRNNTVQMRQGRAVESVSDKQEASLYKRYKAQLEQVNLDFSDLKSPCFPGNKKGGLKFNYGS